MEPVFAHTLDVSKFIPQKPSIKYKGLLSDFDMKNKYATSIVEFRDVDCMDEYIRLKTMYPHSKIGMLNMASARSPGGGS